MSGRAALVLALVLALVRPGHAVAQALPRHSYLHDVPLEVPRAVRQSPASAKFGLYAPAPGAPFRDVAPRDGLDDARSDFLLALGERFAPILIQNTFSAPMDPNAFRDTDGRRVLHVDRWNVGAPRAVLVRADSFDVLTPEGIDSLRVLFRSYHPDDPSTALARARAVAPGESDFDVLWLEFPGDDAKSWREAYEDPHTHALRSEYRDRVSIQLHPFVAAVEDGYELVLQYWFFHPFNDGGNNHLGDWEHVNVLVRPLDRVTTPWSEDELREFLAAQRVEAGGPSALVIRRADIYFHENVFILDYAGTGAYGAREAWQTARDSVARVDPGREWIVDGIRWRAWADDAETVVNPHPIVHIGADNKGTDQVLSPPGGTNRDSHGSYPFAGLYKDIGPAAAAEGVHRKFDHREYFALPAAERGAEYETFARGGALAFPRERLRILPDFEPVLEAMERDDEILRRWFTLVVPVRFGYPCVESPLAGIVAHAETGNLAVVGGSFNGGWNGIGATGGFSEYHARALPGYFPTAWQDQFDNELGVLNLTYPTLAVLPPFSLVWWGAAAPARAILQPQPPHFFRGETLPARFVGVGVAQATHEIDESFFDLLLNKDQFRGLALGIFLFFATHGIDSLNTSTGIETVHEPSRGAEYEIDFHVGKRFVSENRLRHARSTVGQDAHFDGVDEPLSIRAELNFWEYAGSLRYNLTDSRFVPHVRAGYGLSWYRLEKTTVAGVPLEVPNSPWIRKPSLWPLAHLLPNTLHVGAGVEWFAMRSRVPSLPRGLDLVLRASWALYVHDLGVDFDSAPIDDLISLGLTAAELPQAQRIHRNAFVLGATVSF